jgi:hypothetical protein
MSTYTAELAILNQSNIFYKVLVSQIGSYLCNTCNSTDDVWDAFNNCPVCHISYCSDCGRGCNCSWRYMDYSERAVMAVLTIQRAVIRRFFSTETCEFAPIVGYYQWGPTCGSRVSNRLIAECQMVEKIFGGHGIMCRRHICPCQDSNDDTDTFDNCDGCYNDTCTRCHQGCTCGDY